MRNTIKLLCLLLLPVTAQAGEIANRAFALQARSLVEGLTGVAASGNLSVRDRQILRVMAQLEGDSLAAAILGPEPEEFRAPLRAVRSSPQAATAGRWFAQQAPITWGYTVTFENRTSEDLDEVVVFWQRKVPIGPVVRESRAPFAAHTYYPFVLGKCNELGSYVIGVFLNGKRIFKVPEGEKMSITSEIASRFHPDDTDPCGDSWALYEH